MRFFKEIIVLTTISVFLIVSDTCITKFTQNSIDEINTKVDSILEKALNEENYIKDDEIKKINDLENSWKEIENKLAYFTEHDELEKVTVDINTIKAYAEADLQKDAYEKMKELKYRIEHIKAKQKFKLNNMF